VYAPEVVAETILRCAEKRIREITVGGGGRMMTVMGMVAPRTTDIYMESAMFEQQKDPDRPRRQAGSLYAPKADGRTEGPYRGHVMHSSVYTRAMLSDVGRALPFIAAGLAIAAGVRSFNRAA
jgi:hypothetical protein